MPGYEEKEQARVLIRIVWRAVTRGTASPVRRVVMTFFSSVVVLNDCCPSERVYRREQWALLGGGVEVTPGRRGNDGWSTA